MAETKRSPEENSVTDKNIWLAVVMVEVWLRLSATWKRVRTLMNIVSHPRSAQPVLGKLSQHVGGRAI